MDEFIFGLDRIRDKVVKICTLFLEGKEGFIEAANELSIVPTFLFYGYPGTGKTTLANQIYKILKSNEKYGNINIYRLNIDSLLSSNFGESSKNIIAEFEKIKDEINRDKAIAYIIIDELDFFTNNRYQNNNESITRVLLTFNKIIDDLIREKIIEKMIIVATTNVKDNIDTSVLRRFYFHEDFNIELDEKEFEIYLSRLGEITGLNIPNKDKMLSLYKIFQQKKFTLGEIKKIVALQYISNKIEMESKYIDSKFFVEAKSYHELIEKQKGEK